MLCMICKYVVYDMYVVNVLCVMRVVLYVSTLCMYVCTYDMLCSVNMYVWQVCVYVCMYVFYVCCVCAYA